MPCSGYNAPALFSDAPSILEVSPSDGAISKVYNDSTKAARDRSDRVEDNTPLFGYTDAGDSVLVDASNTAGVLSFGNPEDRGSMEIEESMGGLEFSENVSVLLYGFSMRFFRSNAAGTSAPGECRRFLGRPILLLVAQCQRS